MVKRIEFLKGSIMMVIFFFVYSSLGYGGCPPLQFDPPPLKVTGETYIIAPGTKVSAPDCWSKIHTCSNTAGYWGWVPHYITITGSKNEFYLLDVNEENVSVKRADVVDAISSHVYDDISLTTPAQDYGPSIETVDIPPLDDIQGVPPSTVTCEAYDTSRALTFSYVPELEKRVHKALENWIERVNRTSTGNVTTFTKGNMTITMNVTKVFHYELQPISTALDRIDIIINVTNVTQVENATTNKTETFISTEVVKRTLYVSYEKVFRTFYDQAKITVRSYRMLCGVDKDIKASRVRSFIFSEPGRFYIYGTKQYEVEVVGK